MCQSCKNAQFFLTTENSDSRNFLLLAVYVGKNINKGLFERYQSILLISFVDIYYILNISYIRESRKYFYSFLTKLLFGINTYSTFLKTKMFGWPTATLLLVPAEGWRGPSGPAGSLWPPLKYNICKTK